MTISNSIPTIGEKRKRQGRGDATDPLNYQGPWAGYEGENIHIEIETKEVGSSPFSIPFFHVPRFSQHHVSLSLWYFRKQLRVSTIPTRISQMGTAPEPKRPSSTARWRQITWAGPTWRPHRTLMWISPQSPASKTASSPRSSSTPGAGTRKESPPFASSPRLPTSSSPPAWTAKLK